MWLDLLALVGTAADFEYDAIADLVFEDESAIQAFFAVYCQGTMAAKFGQG